ncbi:laccase lcc6 [Rhodocollybia butyracea]|uniref:laccase n=1 Tax=Rhodocollybia butyracea TaxID=206335 RepID=A0A9P5UAS6_9AGAR|nr:laccase lcc6 [Rhodocollybia butyracea]
MLSVAALLLLAPLSGTLAAIGPVTDLHIVNAFLQPDGYNRSYVVAEGTFPGPLITGNKGDNFQINVINELTNDTMLLSTSIHWHGFFQKGTNWADGSFINQCPIAQNNSFLYNFNVPDQAGTFWYHSHLATQYCDGLRGPIVVYDPNDPLASLYDIDDESTIITLADLYDTPATLIRGVAVPDATIINGLGRSTSGPADAPLAVISVTQNKRYRFRLISISCDPNFVFSIDGHTFSIIEADGVETQSVPVDSVQIFAAQRYSFVLTANQTVDNYWVRANPSTGKSGFVGGINSAILRYDGAPVAEPTTTSAADNLLAETSLSPLVNPGAPGLPTPDGVDVDIVLNLGFAAPHFTINGATFVPPTVPVLLQILSGTTSAASLLPSGSVYGLPLNSTIQLSFNAATVAGIGGPHPFHLHGHTFDIIRSAGTADYNYVNPPRRDVVSTGNGSPIDNVTIRFTTDNAGPWFLHCHIDWHLEAGFAIVFAEDIPDVASANPVPEDWSNLCPIYDALTPAQLGGGGGPTT